jgi:hypothetical protein
VRFLAFTIAAVGVHLLIPVGARVAPRWDTLQMARSTGLAQRMLIEIEPLIDIPTLPNPEDPKRDQQKELATNEILRPRTNVDPNAPPTPNPDSTAVIPPDELPPAAAASGAPPDEYGSLPPSGSDPGGIPGLGTGPLWAIPGVVPEAGKPKPAPTTIAAAPPTDPKLAGRIISDVVREKDRGLGLDLPGAGTILSITKEAVRSSNTPEFARATFEVRIAPGGAVSNVKVLRSSAGVLGDWNAVAADVRGRLAGRSFTLPEAYAAGAIVTVEIVSQLQMPDGSTSGRPSVGAGAGNNVGGSVTFDASNIGARPKRHVGGSVSARPAT